MENITTNTNPTEAKCVWQRPTIGYIDIKRTMSTAGGSQTDSLITGGSKTTQV